MLESAPMYSHAVAIVFLVCFAVSAWSRPCPSGMIWGLNGEAGSGSAGLIESLPAGVIRGGNFKMREAAGVLTMSLNASPAHFRETTGFRRAIRK
ncbi:MAG: hypothetical protein NDI61_02060 [Bdellovibrionaceae bacterium]|nr:hypothetical protein [Pseudobdellovibrionaceae bacterium]